MISYEECVSKIRETIIAKIDLSRELSDEELSSKIDEAVVRSALLRGFSARQKAGIKKDVFDSFRRLDVLQEIIEDEDVTEIMVNGTSAIFYEKGGRIFKSPRKFASREKLDDVVQQIVSRINRSVNTSSPIADARLADGSRVNVVLPPIAPEGPIVTIRRFSKEPITMNKLVEYGSLTAGVADFLKDKVEKGYNIFISGGTGSGKTTFLNALSEFIPNSERIITIEDSLELKLDAINLVRLEARAASGDMAGEISIRDLIRTALRMRPDRLIVGEVRGTETLDMLQAMNTGHDGSLSTGHGNSPRDMLSRLETMVLMGGELPLSAVRGQIGGALDLMVHLGRFPDGSRKVISIVEVLGYEDGEIKTREIYKRKEGTIKKVGEFEGRKREGSSLL